MTIYNNERDPNEEMWEKQNAPVEEKNVSLSGWTALTEILGGENLVWKKVEDGKEYMPDIYPTEKDVWKSIADDQITMLQQVIDDEREPDEMDWTPQDRPVQIEIYEDGTMVLFENGNLDERSVIIETTLQKWREGL